MEFSYEDNGFCRVVFTRTVEDHKYAYCWQLEGPQTFKFYRCSRDHEPEYEVMGWGGVPAAQMTPKNPGETLTGRELNAFLAALEAA